MPQELEDSDEFILRYRRLFGNLNRYAKPMSQYDNIVMDEDDTLAIITRRLVTSHLFFKMPGSEFKSSRIKMAKGKNVTTGSSHFTSLEMLYEINEHLLATAQRRNRGWGVNGDRVKEYKRFRPLDDEIDGLEAELTVCWDGLTAALPVLSKDPARMRVHNPSPESAAEEGQSSQDNVLFWPIVQVILADLARELLDDTLRKLGPHVETLTKADAQRALDPLGRVTWDAHSPPWRHVLLVLSGDDRVAWRITSEDRKNRLRLLERIIRWQIGLDRLGEDEITGESGLRGLWYAYLPAAAVDEADEMWAAIEAGVQR